VIPTVAVLAVANEGVEGGVGSVVCSAQAPRASRPAVAIIGMRRFIGVST
jgi:hypothetical protein